MKTLLIVGYGNLAKSILLGLKQSKILDSYCLQITGRSLQKIEDLMHSLSLDAQALMQNTLEIQDKIVFLCTKPKGLNSFSFHGEASSVYSVMAGVKITQIQAKIQAQRYIRLMPNVGAFFQQSATTAFSTSESKEALEETQELIKSFGSLTFVGEEDLIDSSIATSGSTPAFLALVAQALIDAGVREGLTFMQSKELVCSTFEGFATLLKHYTPQEIKTLVTSPGGTTAEGLAYLYSKGFEGILQEASHKSVLKAKGKL